MEGRGRVTSLAWCERSELIISMGAAGLLLCNYCVITNPHVIQAPWAEAAV